MHRHNATLFTDCLLPLIIHISKQKLMSLPAAPAGNSQLLTSGFKKPGPLLVLLLPEFYSSLHEFLRRLYIFQHASLLLSNTFLTLRFDSSYATWSGWLSGDVKEESWLDLVQEVVKTSRSPRWFAMVISDTVAVSSLYLPPFRALACSRLCDLVANAFTPAALPTRIDGISLSAARFHLRSV